jgi:hypothetical protein
LKWFIGSSYDEAGQSILKTRSGSPWLYFVRTGQGGEHESGNNAQNRHGAPVGAGVTEKMAGRQLLRPVCSKRRRFFHAFYHGI